MSRLRSTAGNKTKIGEQGGVSLLLTSLKTHMGNEGVTDAVCGALRNLVNRCGKPPLFDGHLKSLQWIVVVNWRRAAIKFRLHASQPRAEHRTAGRKSARRCYVCKVALSLQKESGPETQGIGFGAAIRVCLKGEKGPDPLRQSI